MADTLPVDKRAPVLRWVAPMPERMANPKHGVGETEVVKAFDYLQLEKECDALRLALTAKDEQIAAALRLLREGDDDDQTRIGAVRILAGSATA